MTYKLERFIAKIKSPVVCVFDGSFDGKEVEFTDGAALAKQSFEEPWITESIAVSDNRVLLVMKRKPNTVESDNADSFF